MGFGAIAARAAAAETSAHDFVAAIYDSYVGKNANGIRLDNARTVRRYFESSLAALMLKDQEQSRRRNEVGALDFDPFVDAQDWDIATYTLSVSEPSPGRASATVMFNNSGQASTVALALTRLKGEWRIANITWRPHEKPDNLRALYAS